MLQSKHIIVSYVSKSDSVKCSTVNFQDKIGATPLYLACQENEYAVAKQLLQAGADPNITIEGGKSPLHEAASNGSIRTCRILIEHGANVEQMSSSGSPLHLAVSEKREKTASFLLEKGANVNARNADGITPLILCCILNVPNIAKTLLENSCDITCTVMEDLTALHIAAETGCYEIVEAILSHRSKEAVVVANARSKSGVTPIQLAAGANNSKIVEILKPITKGFEDADTDTLISTEAQRLNESKMEKAHEEPAKTSDHAPVDPVDPVDNESLVPTIVDSPSPEALMKAKAFKEEGNKAFLRKNHAEAVDFYSQAIELDPSDAILYSNRCAAYLSAGDPQKALQDAYVAKKLNPKWTKAIYREAQCLEALERYEDAACVFWNAVKLAPEDKGLKKRFQDCVSRGRKEHLEMQKE